MTEHRRTRTEDYLAAVVSSCQKTGQDRASTGDVASLTGVAKGTASSVLKELADEGLVDLVPYDGVSLTESGQQRLATSLRRLRLIEIFLARTLQLSGDDLATEAWLLEPAVSTNLICRIEDAFDSPSPDMDTEPEPPSRADDSST